MPVPLSPLNPLNLDTLLSVFSTRLGELVERAGASLVQIETNRRPATGVAIAAEIVVTVDHLLDEDADLRVRTPDGRLLSAAFAGRDPTSDLAVLRVGGLEARPIRAADGPARPGELAVAVARDPSGALVASFGLFGGVLERLQTRFGAALEQVVRIEAFSSPGFTGGVVVDARGDAIGITNAALVRGARLAVPAVHAWKVAEMIAARGSIRRGYLGIGSQPVRIPESQRGGRTEERGLLVASVMRDSPADRAGILVGDIIVAFDERPTSEPADLQRLLGPDRVGTTASLRVLRAGAVAQVQVAVGSRE